MSYVDVVVTEEPLIFHLDAMTSPEDGAMVTFFGTVRGDTDGRPVDKLEYEAYADMAERQLRQIAEDARSRWQLGRVVIHHRTGSLGVGDCSVVIAVTAPHRDAAFLACRFCIEELKANAAIWKKEHFSDGTSSWVNHP